MKIYVQVDENLIIRDALTFPHNNYVEVDVQSIPIGIHGGWFKLIDGKVIEIQELKPIDPESEIDKLKAENLQIKQELETVQQAMDFLIMSIPIT